MNAPTGALVGRPAEDFVESYLGWPLATLLKFPKYITLEVINRCNAACIMCGIDFSIKEKAVLSPELLARLADELGEWRDHVEKVIIALDGEPLLDNQVHEKVRVLKRAGLRRVNVTTNASLLSRDRARALIEAGTDEIYITIDSLKKEIYESIRKKLDFDTVHGNTIELVKLRDELGADLTIRVLMVQQALNREEGEAFKRYWRGILSDRDQIAVQRAHNWARNADVMTFGDEPEINNIPCISLWGTLGIHADGRVGLCCMDTTCVHPLGDLNHDTLEDIWKSPAMARARRLHLQGRRAEIPICDGCTVWRVAKRELADTGGPG